VLEDMYRICAAPMLRASAFPIGIPAAQPLEVRDWFGAQLDRMVAEGRAIGLEQADLDEARYALVAYIDEKVLRSSWPGREEWMRQPLQLICYRENIAGENFFRRLRALLRAPRRLPAIQMYALCLAHGFRGAYQQSDDVAALGKFQRAAFRRLFEALPSREVSSPHLERPPCAVPQQQEWPLLLALCVGVLLVGLVLIVCSWSVQRAELAARERAAGSGEQALP
jgi:type VI secretion system protein ImpK